jgi:hypothetical protein
MAGRVERHLARHLVVAREQGRDGLVVRPEADTIAAIVDAGFWTKPPPRGKARFPGCRWPGSRRRTSGGRSGSSAGSRRAPRSRAHVSRRPSAAVSRSSRANGRGDPIWIRFIWGCLGLRR